MGSAGGAAGGQGLDQHPAGRIAAVEVIGRGRRPGLRVMGTTQLARRVDQMWPLGLGVVGLVVDAGLP